MDTITLGIVWNRLQAIMEEQAVRMVRAGLTTSLSEGGDCACALFDSCGHMITQSSGTPGLTHTLPSAIQGFFERFPPKSLNPGDVLITNDPWLCSGHLNDIVVAAPIFLNTTLVGFNATCCHAADIGGVGFSADARDLFGEGLQIPRIKLYRAGSINDDVVSMIQANVRTPKQVLGDIVTQAGTIQLVATEVLNTLAEFGLTTLDITAEAIIKLSRTVMQRAISEIPPGIYYDELLTDGVDEPIKIKVAVEVGTDQIVLDFTGTSPSVSRGINCVANYTRAYAFYALKSALCPELPNNEGVFAPIQTIIPEGSILNCKRPAPVSARHLIGHFVSFAIYGALSQVIPERVIADSSGPCGGTLQLTGLNDDGDQFSVLAFSSGGLGARPNKDGTEATHFPANAANTPLEVLERVAPIIIHVRELIADSGGPGTFRGGCGQRITFSLLSSLPANMALMFERVKHPARGFDGGLPGALSRCLVNGKPVINPKQSLLIMPGEEITFELAGGGGYFSPEQRKPESVLNDVLAGKVSVNQALSTYKVVLTLDGQSIDEKRTAKLRGNMEGY